MDEGSYHVRRNLQYVKQKPKFLQNLLGQQAEQDDRNAERRLQNVRIDDEPVLVDSEGNPIPDVILEQDKKLDSAFSDMADLDEFEQDAKLIEESLSREDKLRERPSKKARSSADSPARQLSKLKSDTRLLSFEDE